MTGSLIELCQTASQISRITFLTRHLFQTSRHLSKSLSPTGGGVSHQRYGIAHVTEILSYGNTCINRSLTGCNRHIRCVGDQYGSLHQGLACFRVLQFRELVQYVGHLVSTLAASDVNHDISLCPFCKLMLNNRLTASERSRNGSHTTFGDWEHTVNNSLSCYERLFWRKLFLIRTTFTNRPFLHHGQLFVSVFCLQYTYNFFYGKLTGFDLFDFTFYIWRNHNLLFHNDGLFYCTKYVSAFYFISDLCNRYEVPLFVSFQCRNLNTSLQAVASGYFHNIVQWSLDTIVDAGDQSRSQFYGKRYFHGFYRLARFQSGSLLIYLNRCLVPVHLDDLTDQSLVTYTNHVKHVGVSHALSDNQWSGHFLYRSFTHLDKSHTFLKFSANISILVSCSVKTVYPIQLPVLQIS